MKFLISILTIQIRRQSNDKKISKRKPKQKFGMKPNSANLFVNLDQMIQLHANAPNLHCFKLDLSPCYVLQAKRFRARNQKQPVRRSSSSS